jgi:quinol monooxygenase YgiN
MFARVTKYRMKPECLDDATALTEKLMPKIKALPGLLQFINVCNDDGNGYIVSIVDNQENSNANQEHVQAIWAEFADYLAEAPTPEGYNVLFNERNG